MKPRLYLSAFAFAVVLLGAPAASALPMDPAHAQADVDAAMRERAFAFCRDPNKPLSEAARVLCPHAASLPDCGGFVAACKPEDPEEESSFFRKLAEAIAAMTPEFVKSLFRAMARLPAVVFLTLVAVLLGAGFFAVARSMRGIRRNAALREGGDGARAATPDEELAALVETTDAEVLLALAESRAREGKNDMALQLYLAASLRALDRRGVVRWAKDRTNGEYVRTCDEPSRGPLRELVRESDRVQFGRVSASAGVVARAAELAAGIVRLLTIVMLVLALPGLVGCNGSRTRKAGDDPAGDELFYEVLKRQGVGVDALDGPLGSLPPPGIDQGPAVVVDAETTPLDDETGEHLVEWVRSGGVLVLFGAPEAWPRAFRAKPARSESSVLSASYRPEGAPTVVTLAAQVVDPAAFELDRLPAPADTPAHAPKPQNGPDDDADDDERPETAEVVASFGDRATYAAAWPSGAGVVLGVASDELTTNAGLARAANAAALIAILSHADRSSFAIAEPEDGTAPPSSPVTALKRAGLGLALAQAIAGVLVLFVATGARLANPRPASPPRRRAFVEHVEAVGALYARTGAARHALASYTRFVEQRLRARMPRGTADVAAFLASRSHLPLDVCERLLNRANAAAGPDGEKQPAVDDLVILKELTAAYAAATARER
jgi:hypothetical protein